MSDPKEPTPHAEDTNDIEGHDPDEGSGESDGETDVDGDEGDDTEHAEDAAEATPGAEEEVSPPAQPARRSASDVIRAEKKARKDFEARAATAQAERDQARQRAEAAERRAEAAERAAQERRAEQTREAEAARLETMTESERIAHYRQKDREEFQQEVNGLKFQQWDSTDRMEFRQLVREDPAVARVRDKVEVEFERLRAQGRPVAREILANQEIAKLYRAELGKSGTKQRERAAAGVKRETVRPRQTRSDVPAERTRRSGGDEKEARLNRIKDLQL